MSLWWVPRLEYLMISLTWSSFWSSSNFCAVCCPTKGVVWKTERRVHMNVLGGLVSGNNMFDDIIDLIIILIVLEFLCSCVLCNHDCWLCISHPMGGCFFLPVGYFHCGTGLSERFNDGGNNWVYAASWERNPDYQVNILWRIDFHQVQQINRCSGRQENTENCSGHCLSSFGVDDGIYYEVLRTSVLSRRLDENNQSGCRPIRLKNTSHVRYK